MVPDEVAGDAEQPRKRGGVLDRVAGPPPKGTNEDLGREILSAVLADAPAKVAVNGHQVTLIDDREARGLGERLTERLRVGQGLVHASVSQARSESSPGAVVGSLTTAPRANGT
jgi:hypothetical protein